MKFKMLKFNEDDHKYSELKNYGYKFQKLFAGNYMQWCKRLSEHSSRAIHIWKKGSDVEISDLYHLSGLVAEYIRDYELTEADHHENPFGSSVYLRVVINKKTNLIETYDPKKHNSTFVSWDFELEELREGVLEEWYKTYNVFVISEEFFQMIKELWKNNLVKIIEEELEN